MGEPEGGLKIWAVSDGRAGIERQSVSLARALAEKSPARIEVLRLTPDGLQTRLRPDLWPNALAALPADQRGKLGAPWPDVWIATGRRSIPYSRWLKKQSPNTFVVQTQDPKVDLGGFDLVVPPEHDALTGPNVFPILGPPTWWTDDELANARAAFEPETGRALLVSIGGDSKTHTMTPAKADEISGVLRSVAAQGWKLRITVSRRTPEAARVKLRTLAHEIGARFWESAERDGPNPYLNWLMTSEAALVTEDSANMLADPAWFGKPTHIVRLDGGSPRFDRLHQGFITRGAARWFAGEIATWSYEPIREAARAADEIVRRMGERG